MFTTQVPMFQKTKTDLRNSRQNDSLRRRDLTSATENDGQNEQLRHGCQRRAPVWRSDRDMWLA